MMRLVKNLKSRLLYRYNGPRIIRDNYKNFFKKDLDGSQTTLTEKIAHRMINLHRCDNPTFARLADKFHVRDFVRERVGEKYLVDLLWHGTDPRNIPFDDLPERCMAKTNHASGTNHILDNSVERQEVVRKLRKWLKMNYYFVEREVQYKHIKPQVLVEEFIDDGEPGGPLDYRFWCFNGHPEVIQVDNNDHSINSFFDLDWKRLPLKYRNFDFDTPIPKPSNLNMMIKVASALSSEFDFVRVDLYHVSGRILAGELTFTPVAGRLRFNPPDWDVSLGAKWQMKS